MFCGSMNPLAKWRMVGDPIDVVTGANAYRIQDFSLTGPLPFVWARYYDSAQNARLCALGWGHTHEYDRRLRFDLDGVRYMGPLGQGIGFPPLLENGKRFARAGLRIHRLSLRLYQVQEVGQPTMEFHLPSGQQFAPLTRIFKDRGSWTLEYGADGFLQTIIESVGRKIRVDHDEKGRVLALCLLEARAARKRRELLVCRYDHAGNLIEAVDPYGSRLRFRYDENNRQVTRTDRLGYKIHATYGPEGRCVHSSGEDGQYEVRLRYSPAERVTVVTRGDGGQWTYFYNEDGTTTRIIDPYGGVQEFQLNEQGRVVGEIDPKGNVTGVLYREDGSIYGKRFSFGRFVPEPTPLEFRGAWAHRVADSPVEWEYGTLFDRREIALSRVDDALLKVVPVFAHKFIWSMHQVGETQPHEAGPGNGRLPAPTVQREFDDFGLLIRERGPGRRLRSWSYDANGKVRRYHDGDGSTYNYEHSSWNQLTRVTDPSGASIEYRYTPARRLAAVTDAGGTTSEYDYDLKERLVRVRRHGVVREEYLYDQADNLIEKRDGQGQPLMTFEVGPGNMHTGRRLASGETHYLEYDEKGRCIRAATDDLEAKFTYEAGRRSGDERNGQGIQHRFGWAPPGKLAVVETIHLGRFSTRYEYPDAQTMVIHDAAGHSHEIRALDCGLVVRELANRSTEVVLFDPEGRCLFKTRAARQIRDHEWSQVYHYSAEGDLLKAEDSVRGTTDYYYDAAHRLIGDLLPSGEKRHYVYRSGNLIGKPGLKDVVLGDGNRLQSANGDSFEYDPRNHLAVRSGPGIITRYHYNAADMLVRIENGQMVWQATYDPLGRRVSKSWGTHRNEYYWDTDRLAAEVNEQGRIRVYVYAYPLALVPILFLDYESADALPESGKPYYIYCNQIGAPTLVEDHERTVVWRARIDPYGSAEVAPDSRIQLNLRFPGHYFDPETGLHYNRFRYYSPELGRYLQSDPDGIVGGVNLYAYPDNPLTHVDVRGLAPCPTRPYDPEEDSHLAEPVGTPTVDSKSGKLKSGEGEWTSATAEGGRGGGHAMEHVDIRDPAQLQRVTDIMNNPDRVFTGKNASGREVDIYYKDGAYVVTPAGRKTEVITVAGKGFYDKGETPNYQKNSRGQMEKDPDKPGTPSSDANPERWGNTDNWKPKARPGQPHKPTENYTEITGVGSPPADGSGGGGSPPAGSSGGDPPAGGAPPPPPPPPPPGPAPQPPD
jgi:RHS repeat-associated protein